MVEHRRLLLSKKDLYLILVLIITFANILTCTNKTASTAVVAFESTLLVGAMLKNDYSFYSRIYMAIMIASMEFGVQGSAIYSFKETRIAGLNMGIWLGIPILLKAVSQIGKNRYFINAHRYLKKYYRVFVLLVTLGIFFGIIALAINDNGVWAIGSLFYNFLGEVLSAAVYPLICIACVLNCTDDLDTLRESLRAIMFSFCASLVFSFIFGVKSYYGGVETLLINNSAAEFAPLFLLLLFEEKINPFTLIIYIAAIILQVLFNAGGKTLLILGFSIVLLVMRLVAKKKIKTLIFLGSVGLLAIVFSYTRITILLSKSVMFQSKFAQVLDLLNISKLSLSTMSFSPRHRIVEFFNILEGYRQEPFFALFGKGYMGTIKDYLNLFIYRPTGVFDQIQWESNCFYNVHETLNVMFLQSGFLGLFFYIAVLIQFIKNFTKSYWFIIGGVWFLLFYQYSATIVLFGCPCLILGLIELSEDYDCGIFSV